MPAGLLSRVVTKFPIKAIYTNWGITELSSIATRTTTADIEEKKLKTAGRLLPNFTGKIVAPDTGRTLPWGPRVFLVSVRAYLMFSGKRGGTRGSWCPTG